MGDDLIKALVFNAMWTANVKHVTNSPANIEFGGVNDILPDAMRRPVSVMGIANSWRVPYETVRRAVQALIKDGICVRVGTAGLIVPAEVHARQGSRDSLHSGLPSLLRLLSDMKRAAFDFEPCRKPHAGTVPLPADGTLPGNARVMLRICSALIMRGIDTLGRAHGDDFLAALTFSAIWTANVRHITHSAENVAFGGLRELPPDSLRLPVSVNAIARSLRMPYETVRRYAAKMLRDGTAIRIGGRGLIVPRDRLTNANDYEAIRSSYTHLARMIADLHRAGFDFRGY